MKVFANLKVSGKLIMAFVLISLIFGVTGIYAVSQLRSIASSGTELYDHVTVPMSQVGEISAEFERTRVDVRKAISAESPEDIKVFTDDIQKIRENVSTLAEGLGKAIATPEMKQAYDQFVQSRVAYGEGLDQVIELALQNRDAEAMALLSENGAIEIASKGEQDAIAQMDALMVDQAKNQSAANADDAARTTVVMISVIVIVILLSFVIGLYISSLITRPLKKVVHMIGEMNKGNLSERVGITTKDEIGQMASALDSVADTLQTNVVGGLNLISAGDVSAVVEAKGEQDEISPALQKTFLTLNGINNEIAYQIKAVTEGRLDTRANAEAYSGSWKELINGMNELIDAFVEPINMTAEYIGMISKGEIPPKVTDEYYGDFNEIKDNFNNCIEVIEGMVNDTNDLINDVREGQFFSRIETEKFSGEWKTLTDGINKAVETLTGHINAIPTPVFIIDKDYTIRYMNDFGASMLEKPLDQIIGTKCYNNFKAGHCNTEECACHRAMASGQKVESTTTAKPDEKELEINYTGLPIRDQKENIVGAFEFIFDQTEIVHAMRKAEKQTMYQDKEVENLIVNLEKLSNGDLQIDTAINETDEDTRRIGQNFENINQNLQNSVNAIQLLIDDANQMTTEAIEGNLDQTGGCHQTRRRIC